MVIDDIPQTQQKLNQFAVEQWDKALAYLQGVFAMPRSDCEDVFQEAFMVLYKKIIDGELVLTAKLSTFFIGICRNKAYEKMRENGKELYIIDDFPHSTRDELEDERIDRLLALEDNTEQIEARKEAVVREIVANLPAPCDKILWGFYFDGVSMKTLAQMLNYASEGSIKVVKHRCVEKFKTRFMDISKQLFD